MRQDRISGLTLTIMLLALAGTPALAATSGIEYAGVGTSDPETTRTDYPYEAPAISADGRFVAFPSHKGNMAGGTKPLPDILVYDRTTGATELVSAATCPADGPSFQPAISGNGRFVAFVSSATNLVPRDSNGAGDIFVHDRRTGIVERASVGPGGDQANSGSFRPAISTDGRFVAFSSSATNLVLSDGNGVRDIFVHDRNTELTRRVSLGPGAIEGDGDSWDPVISADGRFVAFASSAANLVLSDANGVRDIFVHDRMTGVTRRVSLGPGAIEGNGDSWEPAISADGRFVAFASSATNLVLSDANGVRDIFVHDRMTGVTRRVSLGPGAIEGNGDSGESSISTDGRFVAFSSSATNLVSGDGNRARDIFVHDRMTSSTARASVADGLAVIGGTPLLPFTFSFPFTVEGNGSSYFPSISADGSFVAFQSWARKLLPSDVAPPNENALIVLIRKTS